MMKYFFPFLTGTLLMAVSAGFAQQDSVSFKKTVITNDFVAEGVAVGDVNKDGKPDIMAGTFWFEAPSWKRHEIARPETFKTTEYSTSFLQFNMDVNKDGWIDLIRIGFPGEAATWYENPKNKKQLWVVHSLYHSVGNESPQLFDINNDGLKDLVCADSKNKKIVWISPPVTKSDTTWKEYVISNDSVRGTHRFTHGLGFGDMNMDGRTDVVYREGWWEAPIDRTQPDWTFHPANLGDECAHMYMRDLDGDGDQDVISSSAHGYGIWWHEQVREADSVRWVKHDIFNSFSQSHSLMLVDMNNDGNEDLVTGKRYYAHNGTGDKGEDEPAVLYWFEYKPGRNPSWVPHMIDDNSGVGLNFVVQDINNDKLPDIIISNKKGVFVFERVDRTQSAQHNWTRYVRIAGHGLNKNNIDATIRDAQDTHLYGIEVDNDIPGRYNSFLDPTEKLNDIKALADRAHAINNYAFVYIAGLECITSNAPDSLHTFFKDHPDWVQRDINNRPAVFGGGDAFWINKGDEDVWISPYAKEWRKRYMEIVRQIAATGIDGIYVDIPYWMTHFTGWEDTWASFDDYTVEAFKSKTGLDAKRDVKIGDFNDANFRRWIDFRMQTLTDFMAEIDSNAKSVNANCKTIPEIYPGIGEEAVRVGADVYQLYDVVDAIAHEFSGGEGNAASKTPQHWFDRMIGMYAFRAFAGEKSTWMLSYSWDRQNKVKPIEPMKNLALSNLMAGANDYDAATHVMSGSNDYKTRTLINEWVAKNEKTFYDTRTPIMPVGVYFSPGTRNYFADTFMESFQGIMRMMLQRQLEFQIVTPKTLKEFNGSLLILPDVKCISSNEISQIQSLVNNNKALVVTGESGRYDETGAAYKTNPLFQLLNITDIQKKAVVKQKFIYYPDCPGKHYSKLTKAEFDAAAVNASWQTTKFFRMLTDFNKELAANFHLDKKVTVEASPFISTQITSVHGQPHVFLANFAGLKSDAVVNQVPQKNVQIVFSAPAKAKVFYLPFLGEKKQLPTQFKNNQLSCVIPVLEKGGVVWLETL